MTLHRASWHPTVIYKLGYHLYQLSLVYYEISWINSSFLINKIYKSKITFPNVYFYEKYINIDFKLYTWYNLTNGQAYFKRNI